MQAVQIFAIYWWITGAKSRVLHDFMNIADKIKRQSKKIDFLKMFSQGKEKTKEWFAKNLGQDKYAYIVYGILNAVNKDCVNWSTCQWFACNLKASYYMDVLENRLWQYVSDKEKIDYSAHNCKLKAKVCN